MPEISPGPLHCPPRYDLTAVLIYGLSFCSGTAALIYEVSWAKMLALTFGSTTLSAAAVVAGFMGGMGLGAWLYHFFHDRFGRPLLLYGCLEVGIAAVTALLTTTFYGLPELFAEASGRFGGGASLAVLRFVSVFGLLLVPGALMGATFPALCTAMIRTARGVDRHLGMIYGINTIGAAVGALLAGLVLVERLGLWGSVLTANVLNLSVGCTALASFRLRGADGPAGERSPAETAIPSQLPWQLTGVVLFVSGWATLSYEILWFRALRYTVGNSTYALSIVLTVFLVGLGLGSLLLGRIVRRGSPDRDLGLCQCLVAVLAMLAIWSLSKVASLPAMRDWINIFSASFTARPWWIRLLIDVVVCAVTMLPATLAMGLSFPLAGRLFLGDVRRLGRGVGGAYLLANLGSIGGAVVAAAVLLPALGTVGGTKVMAVANLVLGIWVIAYLGRRATEARAQVTAAALVVLAMVWLMPSAITLYGERGARSGDRIVFSEEGDLATVQVFEEADAPERKVMTVDGCQIGWSSAFEGTRVHRKQVVLAHLPMMLDRRIRKTLNIGLGSASTLQTVAAYPQVETLDCVEISEAVVRGAGLFDEAEVLEDPRVRLVVDDAVHYLLETDRRYDLIISDGKQNPLYSGNAPLLCREFYEYSLARLSERGLFVQWITLFALHRDLTINLRTLCEVFPHLEVFFMPSESLFMVGSRQPLEGRPGMSKMEFTNSPAGTGLRPYHISEPSALLACRVAGKSQIRQVLGEGPLSTWDHLRLDFSPFRASPREWGRAKSDNLSLLLAAEEASVPGGRVWFTPPDTPFRASARLIRRAHGAGYAGKLAEALRLAEEAVAANPADATARDMVEKLREAGMTADADGT